MTCRIAVIADIHGNLPAFDAIMKDLETRDIDHVIIAGDMITDCPDSDEVLTLVRKSENRTVIKGNREQYFLDHRAGLKDHWTKAGQMSAMMWTFDRLSPDNIRFMEQLKDQQTLVCGDLTIRIVHGSPDSPSELLYPEKGKKRFREVLSRLEEDILICGHSHEQWFAEKNGKWALNPGSAGVHFNRGKGAEYAVLAIDGRKVSAELLAAPYSLDELKKRFMESGLFEASPHWSRSIIDSLDKGENISLRMIDYALKLMEKEGISDSLIIPDTIWDRTGEEFFSGG